MTQIVAGSIERIVAKCQCGGCGQMFEVDVREDEQEDRPQAKELGSDVTILKPITAFEIVLEALRGGDQISGPEPEDVLVTWTGFEGGHILCAKCYSQLSDYWIDTHGLTTDRNPTEDDVRKFFNSLVGV